MYEAVDGSFRDPSGSVFKHGDQIIRQINPVYASHYQKLMNSGLYESLVSEGLLISHRELEIALAPVGETFKLITPQKIPFVSYPYEWCFSQLKDAAIATLRICRSALSFDMVLKDASAYNIQFLDSRPVLIDTLSFCEYKIGSAWGAYRQFCEHFLLPLAAAAHGNLGANRLMQLHIDGIPLELAGTLLPARAWLNPWLALHLLAHGKMQQKFGDNRQSNPKATLVSKNAMLGLLDNLLNVIELLHLPEQKTEWAEYYTDTNYSAAAFNAKRSIICTLLEQLVPTTVWDLGGNVGVFSRIATSCGAQTVCLDMDPLCVEQNYLRAKSDGDKLLLPICVDLTAPSPSIGWANKERQSLVERGPADVVLALGLIHHLVIRHNVPLGKVAAHLSELGEAVVVEWVPPDDSQVNRIAKGRWAEIHEYSEEAFKAAFALYFDLVSATPIEESSRVIYLWRRKAW